MSIDGWKKLWNRGPYVRAAIVFTLAVPASAACSLVAPILFDFGVVSGSGYQEVGQYPLFVAAGFSFLSVVAVYFAFQKGEL